MDSILTAATQTPLSSSLYHSQHATIAHYADSVSLKYRSVSQPICEDFLCKASALRAIS